MKEAAVIHLKLRELQKMAGGNELVASNNPLQEILLGRDSEGYCARLRISG